MTPDQIATIVASGESETLEFKRSTSQRRAAVEAICAMLNHRGGMVLFGVEPSGRVIGQEVGDSTIEQLAQEIREIEPRVLPDINSHGLPNGHSVISISVPEGKTRPYAVRGRAFRRVGNTNQTMARTEYNRMLMESVHAHSRWELEPAEWPLEELDEREVVLTVEEAIRRGRMDEPGTRDIRELLRGLGLVRDGHLVRAAVVLFGSGPRMLSDYPQCLVRVARFVGTDRTEFLDNRQFHGHAFELLLKAERFLRDSIPIAGKIVPEQLERIDTPLYPPLATREALANAICHRDYSSHGGSIGVGLYDDRLEITSVGSLPFGLTPEKLFEPHESRPWNPLIAQVFHRRGIIETWGRGTIKMAELTAEAGLPRPEIEDSGDYVTVRFRPTRYVPPQRVSSDVTARQQEILAFLSGCDDGAPFRDIVASLSKDDAPWLVRHDLTVLKTIGLVRTRGHGRGAVWELTR